MKDKPRNTIVTIGDAAYAWGIFLLVASARRAGMDEPFIVGCRGFGERERRALSQFGGVEFFELDALPRSLTCYKPHVMLSAGTEFATWADSDAFFTGNVSSLLAPEDPGMAHFRLRAPQELPGKSWRRGVRGGCLESVPPAVLEAWRRDVESVAGSALASPRFTTTGSACFFSLSARRHRRFLESWRDLEERVLPERDVGVADRSLDVYPQLDESTLNACLMFLPDAPEVQKTFRMDKDPERLFVHFIARPKPWEGWTRRAFRHFDRYVAVAKWAVDEGLELPSALPPSLDPARKAVSRLLVPWDTARPKVVKRLKRLLARVRGCAGAAPSCSTR